MVDHRADVLRPSRKREPVLLSPRSKTTFVAIRFASLIHAIESNYTYRATGTTETLHHRQRQWHERFFRASPCWRNDDRSRVRQRPPRVNESPNSMIGRIVDIHNAWLSKLAFRSESAYCALKGELRPPGRDPNSLCEFFAPARR